MRFLEEVNISSTDLGIDFVIKLGRGWRNAAKNYPNQKGRIALESEVQLANYFLIELEQKIELSFGEFGLHHIHLNPERVGLDLFDAQNSYIGHNITKPPQIAAISTIILRYLKDLENFC